MAFVAPTALVRSSLRPASINHSSLHGARLSTNTVRRTPSVRMAQILPVFTEAMEDYKKDFPAFAERGWGATVKAERWNGRHAMFGLFTLVVTGYCQGHGLIPDTSELLDLSQWGVLGSLGDTNAISLQRAIILVAHVHVLFVSIAATIAPFSFQDKLLLEPGEADEAPAGLFPSFSLGMTKDAELWNSRVAMLGVMCLVGQAVATHTPVLDVLNLWLGNLLF